MVNGKWKVENGSSSRPTKGVKAESDATCSRRQMQSQMLFADRREARLKLLPVVGKRLRALSSFGQNRTVGAQSLATTQGRLETELEEYTN